MSRGKLEGRVLARLHQGLMTPAFGQQLAAEVDRLMAKSPDDATAAQADLETRLRKTVTAIERLLDRLEDEEASDSLMSRLTTREAERDALRAELADQDAPQPIILPTLTELQAIYERQVERLEDLLTGSDHMVPANALLRELLGEVRVWGDPEARDGMAIEIRGEVSRIFQPVGGTQKSAPWGADLSAMQISVVAGAGFGLCRTILQVSR